jgi:hypothetical protein
MFVCKSDKWKLNKYGTYTKRKLEYYITNIYSNGAVN